MPGLHIRRPWFGDLHSNNLVPACHSAEHCGHWLARTINVIHFHSIGFQINSKQTLNRCGKSLSQIASVPIEEPLRYIGWEALDEEAPIGGR
jgi:hypothetical protein